MKKLNSLLLLLAMMLLTNVSFAQTSTLFSIDFKDWTGATTICDELRSTGETINGIFFRSYRTSTPAYPFTIDPTAGTMTWCSNNGNNNYYIAIKLSNVNGAITVSVANGSSKTRFTYTTTEGTEIKTENLSFTQSSSAAPSVATIDGLVGTDHVLYIGRQGSSLNMITSITVTSPYLGPVLSLSSEHGTDAQTVNQLVNIIPITYKGINGTGTSPAISIDWTNNAPQGITAIESTIGDESTMTISGAPSLSTTPGVYGYTISYPGVSTSLSGSITVDAYQVPAPIISGGNNKDQSRKAGVTIDDIVFDIANATGATLTGELPIGLSGSWSAIDSENGKFIISGTLPTESTYPTVYNYTITSTPLVGYIGSTVEVDGTIVVKNPSAKTIAYVTTTNLNANDALLPYLNTKYDVTTLNIANVATYGAAPSAEKEELSGYDVAIFQEASDGGSTYAIPASYIGNMFVLNMKPHYYNSGRFNWGSGSNGNSDVDVTIQSGYEAHPIFNNVTVTGSTINMLEAGITGNGIQSAIDVNIGRVIASNSTGMSIHEIQPGAITIAGESRNTTHTYLMVSTSNANSDKLTANGLLVFENAIEYLLSGQTFTPSTVGIQNTTYNGVFFDGKIVYNPQGVTIQLLDITGKQLMTSNKNISLSGIDKGTYIVKTKDSNSIKIIK